MKSRHKCCTAQLLVTTLFSACQSNAVLHFHFKISVNNSTRTKHDISIKKRGSSTWPEALLRRCLSFGLTIRQFRSLCIDLNYLLTTRVQNCSKSAIDDFRLCLKPFGTHFCPFLLPISLCLKRIVSVTATNVNKFLFLPESAPFTFLERFVLVFVSCIFTILHSNIIYFFFPLFFYFYIREQP